MVQRIVSIISMIRKKALPCPDIIERKIVEIVIKPIPNPLTKPQEKLSHCSAIEYSIINLI